MLTFGRGQSRPNRRHRALKQMARCDRRTAMPATRPNESGEDALNRSLLTVA